MSGDNKTDNSIEEQVSRISGNFESDILRLIKTQSMIKTSSGIIDEEIQYLGSKTKQIQDKLDELNLKASELSDFLQVSFHVSGGQKKGRRCAHIYSRQFPGNICISQRFSPAWASALSPGSILPSIWSTQEQFCWVLTPRLLLGLAFCTISENV